MNRVSQPAYLNQVRQKISSDGSRAFCSVGDISQEEEVERIFKDVCIPLLSMGEVHLFLGNAKYGRH